MVAMSKRAQSYVWFGLGAVGLLGLWLTCLLAPEWSETVGYFFLATPLVAMLITVRPGFRADLHLRGRGQGPLHDRQAQHRLGYETGNLRVQGGTGSED